MCHPKMVPQEEGRPLSPLATPCGTVVRKKTKVFLMKKLPQFQDNKMFACTKFRRKWSRDIVLGPENLPKSLA